VNQLKNTLISRNSRVATKVPMGEVVEILNGFAFKSSEYVESGIRVLRISNVQKGKIVDAEPKFYPLASHDEIARYLLREGDLLMSLTGNVGRVGQISSALLPAGLNQRVACLRVKDTKTLNLRYLFHFLDDKSFELDCLSAANGSAQSNLSTEWLKDYSITLPPLDIQNEIVRILDTFVELDAELDAELKARKSQFEFYRSHLLSFRDNEEEGVRWIPMGEICEMSWGNTSITKASYIDSTDGYLAYSAAGPDGKLPGFEFDRDAVVLSAIGARCGKTYFATGKWTCIKNTIYFYSKDSQVLDKYLFWYTNRESFWPRSSSAQPFISLGDARKLVIPIPDLETQKLIVNSMDKLDSLINDISIGLPAEIVARRKQHEYYRKILLSFKSSDAV